MNRATVLILIIVFTFCSTGQALCQSSVKHFGMSTSLSANRMEELRSEVTSEIEKALKKKKFAGISIAVFSRDTILWQEGFGLQAADRRATEATVYPIGSVSKVITATAIMRLVQEGRVDLDRPYVEYVPEFSMRKHFEGQDFTVRDLLTHYSGVPRVRVKGLYSDDPEPFIGLLQEAREDYLLHPPKTFYQYSDWGYTLLGILIETVSGKDFRDFVQEEVFTPLGMDQSSLYPYENIDNITRGFDDELEETKLFRNRTLPADGVKSTVGDLARFNQVFISGGGGEYLRADLIEEMIRIQDVEPEYPLGIGYRGLGWMITDYYGYESIGHYGDMYPCISGMLYFPEVAAGVAVLSNSYQGIGAAKRILNITSDLLLGLDKKDKDLYKKDKKEATFETEKIASEAEASLEEHKGLFTGRFATPIGVVDIQAKGNDKYSVDFWQEGKRFTGVPMGTNSLLVKKLGFTIFEFHLKAYEGEDILWYKEKGLLHLAGKRISDTEISGTWKQTIGTYKVRDFAGGYEFLSSFRIYEREGMLLAEGTTIYPTVPQFQIVLGPISDEEAIVQGLGGEGMLGETVPLKISDGEVELRFLGYELVKTDQ